MFDPELVTDRNFATALVFMVMIGVMMLVVGAEAAPSAADEDVVGHP